MDTDGDTRGGANGAPEALRGLGDAAGEIKEYASYFLNAKVDGFKGTLRNAGLYAALGIIGVIVGTVLATAAVLLLRGIAHGLGELLDQRYWLGELIVGVVFLGGLTVILIFGLKWLMNKLKSQTVAKYEERQRQQRINFGHDVKGRAQEQRSPTGRDAGRAQ